MTRPNICFPIMVVGAMLCGCAAQPTGSTSAAAPLGTPAAVGGLSAATLSTLSSDVVAEAQAMGDSNPSLIEASAMTYGDAADLVQSGHSPAAPGKAVYIVYARGKFSGAAEKLPPLAKPSPGTTLTIIVDAGTMQITDIGISNHELSFHTPTTTITR